MGGAIVYQLMERVVLLAATLCFLPRAFSGECVDGEIRTDVTNRLEICYNTSWVYACNGSMTGQVADVACRQLQFVSANMLEMQKLTSTIVSPVLTFTYTCSGHEISLSVCEMAVSDDCSSELSASLVCSNNFLPFLELEVPGSSFSFIGVDAIVPNGFESFALPGVPIGQTLFFKANLHVQGFISFGSQTSMDSIAIGNPQIYAMFPFQWLTEPSQSSVTTIQASIHTLSIAGTLTPQMETVSRFIHSNTDKNEFSVRHLVIAEWKNVTFSCCPDQPLSFQGLIASDLNMSTVAIFSYQCLADDYYYVMHNPHPISGSVGVNIPGIISEEFRYSRGPHSIELRCINILQNSNAEASVWYNLVYTLTGDASQSAKTTGDDGCVAAGFSSSSCCQRYTDPSTSCRVSTASGYCYCDGYCFEREDCCSDVSQIAANQLRACVPTCTENEVMKIGTSIYPDGPIFMCLYGSPSFTTPWDFATNALIACMDVSDEQEMSSLVVAVFPPWTSYPVRFHDVECKGGEEMFWICGWNQEEFIQVLTDLENLQQLMCTEFSSQPCDTSTGDLAMLEDEESSNSSGIVLMCAFGQWTEVCADSNWNQENAAIICKHLGFSGEMVYASVVPIAGGADFVPVLDSCFEDSSSAECFVMTSLCPDKLVAMVDCQYTMTEPSPSMSQPVDGSADVGLIVSLVVLLLLISTSVIIAGVILRFYKNFTRKRGRKFLDGFEERETAIQIGGTIHHSSSQRYFHMANHQSSIISRLSWTMDPKFIQDLDDDIVVYNNELKLQELIGEGEFGLVYKGMLQKGLKQAAMTVAVKTLKGSYSQEDIHDFLREGMKMSKFSHPNVMTLIGVCLDAGPLPYIILPFMANGCLLSYLQQERETLLLRGNESDDQVNIVQSRLLSLCLQIAKGMAYLSSQRVVHRDLSARNCMMDHCGIIKVADFGLSKSLYEKTYFRQDMSDHIKLPVKWLALESIQLGTYTEKSDVWAFGVTCWEVFSGGMSPYPGINSMSLEEFLQEGMRMDKPENRACSNEIYDLVMTNCWEHRPENRPTFEELVSNVNTCLNEVAEYLDFNELTNQQNKCEDSSENGSLDSDLV